MDKLKEILMDEDVIVSINSNLEELSIIIPEIKPMFGFLHNHPHHHLDVWEHTLLALSKSPCDFNTRLVLLLHDIGKPFCYQDEEVRHFKGHSKKSRELSKGILKRLEIEDVNYLLDLIEKYDDIISEKITMDNYKFHKDLLVVQYCDALAHRPDKLAKRIEYIVKKIKEFKLFSKNNNLNILFGEEIEEFYKKYHSNN